MSAPTDNLDSTAAAAQTVPAAAALAADVAADAAAAIDMLRSQIDAMDGAITRLVAERVKLSHRIQTTRINGGGTRVELGRERIVRDGYRDALGVDGAHLADAVLRVCRGAAPTR